MYHYTGIIFFYFSRLPFWKTRFRFREESVRSGYTFFVQGRPFICRDGPGKGMVGKCIGLKPKLYNCTNSCETVIELYSKLNILFLLFNIYKFIHISGVFLGWSTFIIVVNIETGNVFDWERNLTSRKVTTELLYYSISSKVNKMLKRSLNKIDWPDSLDPL